MTWTTPVTWATNQLVTAANMNEQVRDNLNYLLAKPTVKILGDTGANYSTSSTSFVDVDVTNLTRLVILLPDASPL